MLKVKKKGGDKIYAMKIIEKKLIANEQQLSCLVAEKTIMLNDNPFLVHLHYSFQTDDKLYFVMDVIPGGDLASHLDLKSKFSEEEVRFIIAEIILALEHLHSCGIVYRDLKLENVLLDREGHVCLVDFGMAKELGESQNTHTLCGTPTYLAPEVLEGEAYGIQIDWWSLGVVIFELFTGCSPFDDDDLPSIINNILKNPIIIPDEIPPYAQDLVSKLLQRDPKKRMCCSEQGTAEIQAHPFFRDINWGKLMVKAVRPPYVPKISDKPDKPIDPSELDEAPTSKTGKNTDDMAFNNFTYVGNSILQT